MTVFDKKWSLLTKMSNLTTFETQYLSDIIYFLFLLFKTNVLSYLSSLYHNFENLTLYGIYKFSGRAWVGYKFSKSFFFFFFHYGSRSIFEHRPKMIRRKKGRRG